MTAPLAAVNDFVVKFANVNGSGSASANSMFAKAVLRMGVPVAVRNIFPSNIQGLPTWFEVRVTEAGHLGRRGGVALMVAMNPQTWDKDVAEIDVVEEQLAASEHIDEATRRAAIERTHSIDETARQRGLGGDRHP